MHNLHLVLFLTAAIGPAASPQPVGVSAIPSLTRISDFANNPKLELLRLSPPQLERQTKPSPECTDINGGVLQCCHALHSGDYELSNWLSDQYGYNMTPDVVNGLDCEEEIANCTGVTMCCRVTKLSPLLSMWCESPSKDQ